MMIAQVTGRASLRDICGSLQTQGGRLYHLGISQQQEASGILLAFFEKTYQRCAAIAPEKKKFRFKIVTRLKSNIKYRVTERWPVLKKWFFSRIGAQK